METKTVVELVRMFLEDRRRVEDALEKSREREIELMDECVDHRHRVLELEFRANKEDIKQEVKKELEESNKRARMEDGGDQVSLNGLKSDVDWYRQELKEVGCEVIRLRQEVKGLKDDRAELKAEVDGFHKTSGIL